MFINGKWSKNRRKTNTPSPSLSHTKLLPDKPHRRRHRLISLPLLLSLSLIHTRTHTHYTHNTTLHKHVCVYCVCVSIHWWVLCAYKSLLSFTSLLSFSPDCHCAPRFCSHIITMRQTSLLSFLILMEFLILNDECPFRQTWTVFCNVCNSGGFSWIFKGGFL